VFAVDTIFKSQWTSPRPGQTRIYLYYRHLRNFDFTIAAIALVNRIKKPTHHKSAVNKAIAR
jgi:hypothetical protein